MLDLAQRKFAWEWVGYVPSPEQRAAHLDEHRLRLVAGGERAGKSFSAAMELFPHAIGFKGLFWIVAPDYEQARHEFDYVLTALNAVGAVKSSSYPKVGQCQIETVFGGKIITKSADDVRKLAGAAPDGILLCEAAQCDYGVWLKLRGRLTEKRGWLWASGTFEGSLGWYPELWKRWQADNPEGGKSFSIPTWANLAIFPGGRNDPEIKVLEATLPADMFLERCAAVPCPPEGLVFREFSFETHVTSLVGYDPALPVELAIDPGFAGAYAVVAVQQRGPLVYAIDEVYAKQQVAEQVIQTCKARPWWAKVAGGVIDVAGRQHHAQKSQVEIWRELAGLYLRAQPVPIVDGIARLRTFLVDPASADGRPRLLFAPGLKETLGEFGKYRYPKDAESRPVSEEPIDRDNHAIKALCYWLYDKYGPVAPRKVRVRDDRLALARPRAAETDLRVVGGKVRFTPGARPRVRSALSFVRDEDA